MQAEMYERMVCLVLALLREQVFQCESIEQVEVIQSMIRGLEDPDMDDDDFLPDALNMLAAKHEF